MEDINLNSGWESLYRMSYPNIQTVTSESYLEPSIGTTEVDTPNPSNGNTIIKLLVIGELVYLGYYLYNNYFKINKQDDRNQRF
jgi:hypothetical protein